MAWIRTVGVTQAEGDLARLYEEAIARAGRVFGIVRLSSLNPAVNRAFIDLYLAILHGPSPLSRRERELLATVTSRANSCHY